MSKVAIITGATGIVGTSIVDWLVTNTKSDEWSTIFAISRTKPFFSVEDPRIKFIGLDLNKDEEEITKVLKENGADQVTHVFYTAYAHSDDEKALVKKNVPMFEKFTRSIESIAANLQRITLQTGTKYYGVHLGPIPSPTVESSPRHPTSDEKPNFYYNQEDFLKQLQSGKKWKYTIYRPDMILGVTKGNGMNGLLSIAVYMLVQKELGKKALYPGNRASYKGINDMSYSYDIAQFAVWISTSSQCENEDFLIVNKNNEGKTWEDEWKHAAEFFGVEVEEPTFSKTNADDHSKPQLEYSMVEYMKDKKEVWNSIVKKYGGDEKTLDYATFHFLDVSLGWTWEFHVDMSKAIKLGWTKEIATFDAMDHTFQKMKNEGLIPRHNSDMEKK